MLWLSMKFLLRHFSIPTCCFLIQSLGFRGWKRVGEWREGRIKKEEPFSLLLVHDKRICLESYTDHFLCIHSGFNIGVIFLDLIS